MLDGVKKKEGAPHPAAMDSDKNPSFRKWLSECDN